MGILETIRWRIISCLIKRRGYCFVNVAIYYMQEVVIFFEWKVDGYQNKWDVIVELIRYDLWEDIVLM